MDVPSRSSRPWRVGLFFLACLAVSLLPLLAETNAEPVRASMDASLPKPTESSSMIRSSHVWVAAAVLLVATTIFAVRRTLKRG